MIGSILRNGCVLVLLLGALGCGREQVVEPVVVTPEGAVAKVGETWVLESDIEYYIQSGQARDDAHALRRIVEELQFAAAARAAGLDQAPESRAAQRRMLASRYLEAAEQTVEVSEAELQQAWEASGPRFRIPARVKVAGIRRQFSNELERAEAFEALNATAEAFRNLEDSAAMEDFGAIAASYSDEPNTRYQGGQLGWVNAGAKHLLLPEAVCQELVAEAGLGLHSEPVVSENGAWLFLLTDIEAARVRAFDSVRAELERELRAAKQAEQRARLQEQANSAAPLEMLVDLPQYEAAQIEVGLPSGP